MEDVTTDVEAVRGNSQPRRLKSLRSKLKLPRQLRRSHQLHQLLQRFRSRVRNLPGQIRMMKEKKRKKDSRWLAVRARDIRRRLRSKAALKRETVVEVADHAEVEDGEVMIAAGDKEIIFYLKKDLLLKIYLSLCYSNYS